MQVTIPHKPINQSTGIAPKMLEACITLILPSDLIVEHLWFQFGESQRMRLVRVLRSTVMVRVGGGWQALDEFLVKNDPCRGTSSHYQTLTV